MLLSQFSGALHLTPVNDTFQLRPGLKYLDKIDEKHKTANKKSNEEELEKDKQGSGEDEFVQNIPTKGKGKAIQVGYFG